MTNAENLKRIELEERIVRGLIRSLKKAGFLVYRTFDGESFIYPRTEAQALAAVFNLDEVSLRFVPASIPCRLGLESDKLNDAEHGVLLVLGNGEDVISDWNYSEGDRDGFDKAMQAYAYKEFA